MLKEERMRDNIESEYLMMVICKHGGTGKGVRRKGQVGKRCSGVMKGRNVSIRGQERYKK